MITEEGFVDAVRVAKHLGFSVGQIRKMAHRGEIPGMPFRNGCRTYWRFKISAVDAALGSDVASSEPSSVPRNRSER